MITPTPPLPHLAPDSVPDPNALSAKPCTRFAPSPNGYLHLGHAFSAIVAHDLARARSGRFRLRIEDIDTERSRPELILAIFADLAWLGLTWDEAVTIQSQRLESYAQSAERLKKLGVLYPCRCTRSEIAAAATATGPDGPLYPGNCRGRDVDPDGAAWRLDIARAQALTGPLTWEDENAGAQRAMPEIFGDVVLIRRGEAQHAMPIMRPAYHLTATLDDAADGVTLVTRGTDLFAASHIHRLLQALLGLPVPRWHHHHLLMRESSNGSAPCKLAKRRGSPSLAERRLSGEDGHVLANALRAHIFGKGIFLGT